MTQRGASSSEQFSVSTGTGNEATATGTSQTGSAFSTNTGQQSATSQVVDQARQVAHEATDQVKQQAERLTDQAQSQVTSQLSTQKSRAADSLSSVANALRQTSQNLNDQNQSGINQYVDRAADQVERLSGYLRDKDVGEIVDEVEYFARRQPAVFLGSAFALGLAAARFLKSSRPQSTGYGSGRQSTGSRMYDRGYRGTTAYNQGSGALSGTREAYGSTSVAGTMGTTGTAGSTYGSTTTTGTAGSTYGSTTTTGTAGMTSATGSETTSTSGSVQNTQERGGREEQ